MSANSIVWPKDICSSFASHPRSKTEHPALLIWKKSALMVNARYVWITSPIRAPVQNCSIVYKVSFDRRNECFFLSFFFQELPPECKNGGCFVSKPTVAPKQKRSGLFTYRDVPRGSLGKWGRTISFQVEGDPTKAFWKNQMQSLETIACVADTWATPLSHAGYASWKLLFLR